MLRTLEICLAGIFACLTMTCAATGDSYFAVDGREDKAKLFFQKLDLSRPELREISALVDEGKLEEAKHFFKLR